MGCFVVVRSKTASGLAWEIDFWVHNPHVPGERIVSRERLLLGTVLTPDLLLSRIVNSVLVSRKIVWSRKDGVAWLSSRRIDALTFVRSGLRVTEGR